MTVQRALVFVVAVCACVPVVGCARWAEPQLPDEAVELVCAQLEGQDAEDCRTLAEWLALTAELVARVEAFANEQQAQTAAEPVSPVPRGDAPSVASEE
jgi:hypothetical protein